MTVFSAGDAITVDGKSDTEFTVSPAPYRNDFLHEFDIIEDVMIGAGLETFTPQKPTDFTIGRLLPITELSRKTKSLMIGLGYQEMIFNYVGSRKDYIENMNIDAAKVIEIANPMSENYSILRSSVLPSLFMAESSSATAVYPHKIFEFGKVAYLQPKNNTGTETTDSLGFLLVSQDANYNEAASIVSTLFYFLDVPYEVCESAENLYIGGRQAAIKVKGVEVGHFGEVAPQVLSNWGIQNPAVACEIDVRKCLAL